MDLNLFGKRRINNNFANKFIEELQRALQNVTKESKKENENRDEGQESKRQNINKNEIKDENEYAQQEINESKYENEYVKEKNNKENNDLEEYNLYEKKKNFLDNKSKNGNELAWIMDNNSVCISEDGDGGPVSLNEINLHQDKKIGAVYEKINGKYIYNSAITMELNNK